MSLTGGGKSGLNDIFGYGTRKTDAINPWKPENIVLVSVPQFASKMSRVHMLQKILTVAPMLFFLRKCYHVVCSECERLVEPISCSGLPFLCQCWEYEHSYTISPLFTFFYETTFITYLLHCSPKKPVFSALSFPYKYLTEHC